VMSDDWREKKVFGECKLPRLDCSLQLQLRTFALTPTLAAALDVDGMRVPTLLNGNEEGRWPTARKARCRASSIDPVLRKPRSTHRRARGSR